MTSRLLHSLVLSVVLVVAGCGGASDSAPGAVSQTESGVFSGRISGVDGAPITLPGVEFEININGVTAVGENNNFRPPVAADGTFRLKLPQGLFYPPYGTITFPFEGKKYVADLDPVSPYKGTRDGAPGIVQDFVWRVSGPRATVLNPDVNNATHWYGITMPANVATYRDDTQQVVKPLPDGTRIVWTFKPTSRLIDGTQGQTVTRERKISALVSPDSVNDLPAANYEFSAVAVLPDGATKPALVYEFDERRYKPTARLTLQPDSSNHVVAVPMQIACVVE